MDAGTFDAIISAVGSLGFPIVITIYMLYTNQRLVEYHRDETNKMTEAINDLKNAIQLLIDRVGRND